MGTMERSKLPSCVELMEMPFHVTCVCEEAVPRNEAVAMAPCTMLLIYMGLLSHSISVRLLVRLFLISSCVISVTLAPIAASACFFLAVTFTSSRFTERLVVLFCAAILIAIVDNSRKYIRKRAMVCEGIKGGLVARATHRAGKG